MNIRWSRPARTVDVEARREARFAFDVAVGEGGQRRHLGDQARGGGQPMLFLRDEVPLRKSAPMSITSLPRLGFSIGSSIGASSPSTNNRAHFPSLATRPP